MGSVLEKNSSSVRKRIENHTFEAEDGEEYEASKFHGFGDYFRRKKIKLQNLDADMRASSVKPQIFKGVVAHVTGYTQPPLHILHREIVQHGGGFLQYLDAKTMATHIIASTLPPKKSVDFGRYRIVKPSWVTDSVKAGTLLPWNNYRVLDEGPRQKTLMLNGDHGLSQTSPHVRHSYAEQIDESFYASQMRAATATAGSASSSPSQKLTQVAEKLELPNLSEQNLPNETASPSRARDNINRTRIGETYTILGEPPTEETNGADGTVPRADTSTSSYQASTERNAAAVSTITPPAQLSSEEHNAWLLSDPRMRKSSTANPDFLRQYYSESRLHHLSSWKASLKSSMQKLAAEKCGSVKHIRKRPGVRRYIMHVDFDSFFCAVSLKKQPQFSDKPVVVAHSAGPGSEIASCNYPARKFGVKNGMWMKRALELCPELKALPYDFPAYEEASRLFYEVILDVGGIVQSVSVDEALLDATDIILASTGSEGIGIDEGSVWREQEKADNVARNLRTKIRLKSGCDASVGIGGNILQAKVALRRAKPAGQFQIKPDNMLDVIGELQVENLPGVSHSIGGKLEELGVRFVKDIRSFSRERLSSALGPKTGEKLADYSRGIDRTEVGEQSARKSVSAEVNWGIRFLNQAEAEEFVSNLCQELEKRLLSERVKGKHLTMKVMRRSLDSPLDPAKQLGHGKCDTFNKGTAFGVATQSGSLVAKEAISILRSLNISPGDLRGIGVQMTKLEPVRRYSAAAQASQKTLTFDPYAGSTPVRKQARAEAIEDEDGCWEPPSLSDVTTGKDPIADDPLTPQKPKVHPAMVLAKAAQSDAKASTPLNLSGTQFIIPSNPDLAVLEALPTDIRGKLMVRPPDRNRDATPPQPRNSKYPSEPLPSQLDAEVFNALPEDMKTEVLESYRRQEDTTGLHRSPRKVMVASSKKQITPTKRGGARGLWGKNQRLKDMQAGIVQTNFRTLQRSHDSQPEDEVEELDPEFLSELPEDVRKEVIADHRRKRLARRSGLDAPVRRHQTPEADDDAVVGGQTQIKFPTAPSKVSFANAGVTSVREVKDMLDAWHGQTREDGPHSEDVDVFEKYLIQVVARERDLEKVVTLLRWLHVLVEQDGQPGVGQASWRDAETQMLSAIQGAVKQRGLAPLVI